ncbi:MAG: hypothetical protein AVDCRST_MAG88-3940, partial [uncultured Thermomicrobiales bacterium]
DLCALGGEYRPLATPLRRLRVAVSSHGPMPARPHVVSLRRDWPVARGSGRGVRTEGTAPPRPEGRVARGHVSIGLLGAAGFLVTANARAIDPLLPKLADDFATSVGQVAL